MYIRVVSNSSVIVSTGLVRMWKEVFMAHFKALFALRDLVGLRSKILNPWSPEYVGVLTTKPRYSVHCYCFLIYFSAPLSLWRRIIELYYGSSEVRLGEMVVVYFNVLLKDLFRDTEEYNKKAEAQIWTRVMLNTKHIAMFSCFWIAI